ncbi:MAG: Rab family GTPase [Thermoplasmata archaeon]
MGITEKEIKKKVNLLGAPGVGKTSLILQFVKSVFGDEYLKTIGTNIYTKNIELEDGDVKLVIHDIMGEEMYNTVREGAFLGSTGAIAVADITRPETLDALLNDWVPMYYERCSRDNPIILAVNKFDLDNKMIDSDDLKSKADEFGMTFYTSAKDGKNVDVAFKILASKVAGNLQLSIQDIEDIVENREISSPRELLDVIFAYISEIGQMPYSEREKILAESGIQKFDLEEEIEGIKEEDVLDYADKLMDWFEKEGKDYPKEIIQDAVDKYKSS